MNRFLNLSPEDQRTFIMEAAARRGLSPVIIEKDFWVCLALEKLFQSRFKEYLTFKGGTSLSKVYSLIGRFSEDIDLTIDNISNLPLYSYSYNEKNICYNVKQKVYV